MKKITHIALLAILGLSMAAQAGTSCTTAFTFGAKIIPSNDEGCTEVKPHLISAITEGAGPYRRNPMESAQAAKTIALCTEDRSNIFMVNAELIKAQLRLSGNIEGLQALSEAQNMGSPMSKYLYFVIGVGGSWMPRWQSADQSPTQSSQNKLDQLLKMRASLSNKNRVDQASSTYQGTPMNFKKSHGKP